MLVPSLPPIASTCPLSSEVSVCCLRGTVKDPVAVHDPVAGSYTSASAVASRWLLMMPPRHQDVPIAQQDRPGIVAGGDQGTGELKVPAQAGKEQDLRAEKISVHATAPPAKDAFTFEKRLEVLWFGRVEHALEGPPC